MRKVLATASRAVITHAQNREDIILASFFPKVNHGVYVDVGAGHPDYLSVTKYFYIRGWSGINIEPSERLSNLLTRSRPRDKTYQAAISASKRTSAEFREYLGDGLSTLSEDVKREYEKSDSPLLKHYRDYEVPVMTLATVLKEAGPKEIHFMKIDVEGLEKEVIDSGDWSLFRPHIICLDSSHVEKDWHAIMKKISYEFIFHDGLNSYYADMKYYKELPLINRNFVYSGLILSSPWADKVEDMRREIQEKTTELERVYEELDDRPGSDGEGLGFKTITKVAIKKTDKYITGKIVGAAVDVRQSSGLTSDISGAKDRDKAAWSMFVAQSNRKEAGEVRWRRVTLKGYRLSKRAAKKILRKVVKR